MSKPTNLSGVLREKATALQPDLEREDADARAGGWFYHPDRWAGIRWWITAYNGAAAMLDRGGHCPLSLETDIADVEGDCNGLHLIRLHLPSDWRKFATIRERSFINKELARMKA